MAASAEASEWETSCFGSSAAGETVYGWTAPSSGTFCFDLFDSDYDTSLGIFDEGCGLEMACDEDGHGSAGGYTSYTSVELTEGDIIAIVIDAWGTFSEGTYSLDITEGACGSDDGGADTGDTGWWF